MTVDLRAALNELSTNQLNGLLLDIRWTLLQEKRQHDDLQRQQAAHQRAAAAQQENDRRMRAINHAEAVEAAMQKRAPERKRILERCGAGFEDHCELLSVIERNSLEWPDWDES